MAEPGSLSCGLRCWSGHEVAPFRAIQHDRCQHTRPVGARVYADPVGTFVHLVPDRMSVDHHHAMIAFIAEEFVPNPSQVGERLPVEGYTGPDARVDKDIIADRYGVFAVPDEIDVRSRHQRGQAFSDFLKARRVKARFVSPVAAHRRIAADPHKIAESANIARQRGEEAFLMIADQQVEVVKFFAQTKRAFNHFCRLRSAIDQIAQQDQRDPCRTACAIVDPDLLDQFRKKVVASMNVADRINTLPIRDRKALATGGGRLAFTLPEHQPSNFQKISIPCGVRRCTTASP